MEGWRKKRRKIPPPLRRKLVAGDLLLRKKDGRICVVLRRETTAKAVWGMPGEYRARYEIHTPYGSLRVMDTEIIAGYEVLNYVKRE